MKVEEIGPDFIILKADSEEDVKVLQEMAKGAIPEKYYPDTKKLRMEF